MPTKREKLKTLLEHRRIVAAREQFKPFVTLTFPEYQWNWHHEVIASKLDAFARGEIKNLMLFVPPQHGKSQLVSRHLPAFIFGKRPKTKIAGCSYSADLSRRMNRSVQRIMDEPIYHEVFPNSKLSGTRTKDSSSGSWLRNTEEFEIVGYGGSYKSVGVMGALTGNTVDLAVIDDPVKDALEAHSLTYRNRTWDWYNDVLLTRLDNNAQQLLTMTRWHEDDLAGRILKYQPGEWDVIIFPAIKENNDNADDPREIGEALWPEKHSKEKILKQKKLKGSTFASLYQQRPAPEEGGIIKPEWFDLTNDKHENHTVHFRVDTSYTADKRNDPTAIIAYIKHQGNLIVKRCIARHVEFNDLVHFVVDFCNENGYSNSSTVGIEPKASGKSVAQELRRQTNLNVHETRPPKDSKVTRARSKAAYMSSGRISVINGTWVDQFYSELKSFPNGSHDDQVDVLLMAIDDAQVQSGEIVWTSNEYL